MELSNLMPIKYIINKYKLSSYMIYESIKNDPSFPAINLGPTKNYRIDESLLNEWIRKRSINTGMKNEIPTAQELLQGVKCGN